MNSPTRYLVKAIVARKGQDPSARYVPLDIFELWKSHMAAAYGYQVTSQSTGAWMANGSDAAGPPEPHVEAVVAVTVHKRTGFIENRAERFFSSAELEGILPRFLAHYGIDTASAAQMAAVTFTPGRLLIQADAISAESG